MNRHRVIWTVLSLTWALPINIIWVFVAAIIGLVKFNTISRLYWFNGRLIVLINEKSQLGGISLGWIIFINDLTSLSHELGHTVQNAFYGIFTPFIVHIPSAIRYHWRLKQPQANLKPYYSVWFEKQATNFGEKYL